MQATFPASVYMVRTGIRHEHGVNRQRPQSELPKFSERLRGATDVWPSASSAYGLRVKVPLDYDAATERTTAALKEEGFGMLTTIDVKQTPKQKVDADFRK
jgi:hypothetical protein